MLGSGAAVDVHEVEIKSGEPDGLVDVGGVVADEAPLEVGTEWQFVKRLGGERWEKVNELADQLGGEPVFGDFGDARGWLFELDGVRFPIVRCGSCRTMTVLVDPAQVCEHPGVLAAMPVVKE